MARITRRPRAQNDAAEIWAYVAEHNEAAADRLIERFHSALSLLVQNPAAGRSRDELSRGVRSLPVGRYILFYQPTLDGIDLIRILSGFRDIDSDQFE